VGELVGSIAEASKDQSQGIEQVNASVTKMDKDVQQNAATSEESALASEKMNAQAGKMKGFVKGLTVLIGGNSDDTEGKQSTFTKRYSTQSKSDQRNKRNNPMAKGIEKIHSEEPASETSKSQG
jgi:methyl-accepting chemotaxis protein